MATAEDYGRWIVENADKRGTPEFDTVARAYRMARAEPQKAVSYSPTEGMSGFDKFAAGMGKAIVDTGRGIGQLTGLVSADDVKEARRRDAALMDTGAGFAGNVVGNVGMALAPGGALKGAATVARAIPAVSAAAPALSAAGSTLLAPNSLPSALAVGGAQGFVQPAENIGERLLNTGIGGVATAALPVARTAKAASEPFYESGREQIMGRVLRRVAGDDADRVAQTLAASRELVPGSLPTAGQAAGNAGVAALERAAFAAEPTVTVPVAERLSAQNAARVAALRGASPGAVDVLEAARERAAVPIYRRAMKEGVDPEMAQVLQPQIQNLMERLPRSGMHGTVASKAKELARLNGVNLSDETSLEGLHWMKLAVDDLLDNSAQNGIGKQTKRGLMQFKDDLLTVMDQLSPVYGKAREKFATLSRPVNQAQVLDEIAGRSIRPLDEQLMPNAYARALIDQTAQRATGFGGSTIANTLEPGQIAMLNAIKDDLARAEFAKNAGRGVGSDTVQKLAYNNIMQQSGLSGLPNLLSRPVQLAEYGSRVAYSSADREMRRKLAEALLDPQEAAKLMRAATPTPKGEALAKLLRYGITPPMMATPAVLNAQQQ